MCKLFPDLSPDILSGKHYYRAVCQSKLKLPLWLKFKQLRLKLKFKTSMR